MTTQEAVAILRKHNEWRRDPKWVEWQSATAIGEAIDHVCDVLDTLDALFTADDATFDAAVYQALFTNDRKDWPNAEKET